MNEAILKSALVKEARCTMPGYVVQRHEDRFTHGIPDISIDGDKATTWIEVKYANPGFGSKGIQELTMLRLELAGNAIYVVYFDTPLIKRTYIVAPSDIGKPVKDWTNYVDKFNHRWVVEYVRKVHRDYNRS